jgi:hypothetical protein
MQATEDGFEKAKAILGEHFPHFAIVVQYEDGSIWHEANNSLVEKALYIEALDMLKEERKADEEFDIDWDDEEDDDRSWLDEDDDDDDLEYT